MKLSNHDSNGDWETCHHLGGSVPRGDLQLHRRFRHHGSDEREDSGEGDLHIDRDLRIGN
jgi:hypothetical protein